MSETGVRFTPRDLAEVVRDILDQGNPGSNLHPEITVSEETEVWGVRQVADLVVAIGDQVFTVRIAEESSLPLKPPVDDAVVDGDMVTLRKYPEFLGVVLEPPEADRVLVRWTGPTGMAGETGFTRPADLALVVASPRR